MLILFLHIKLTLKKMPSFCGRGRGKVAILKNIQRTLLLTMPSLNGNSLTRANCVGFYQSLTDLWEWRYPISALYSLSHLRVSKRNRGIKSTC